MSKPFSLSQNHSRIAKSVFSDWTFNDGQNSEPLKGITLKSNRKIHLFRLCRPWSTTEDPQNTDFATLTIFDVTQILFCTIN